MEIRIGIANAREITFDSAESADDVRKNVDEALGSGAATLTFTDNKGSVFIVPTAGIAFVEIGAEETRRVGFFA